jgi:hypothetical protein
MEKTFWRTLEWRLWIGVTNTSSPFERWWSWHWFAEPVFFGMSELNFPTKLICLTKATLTIVTCCVKIQNDCSESFETRQGLRQGDVLSTLLFNVVLEVIVRRANLQTTGTIYNKETQLLAYADDIDIVGRSQQTAKVGLKINEEKTKYKIYDCGPEW